METLKVRDPLGGDLAERLRERDDDWETLLRRYQGSERIAELSRHREAALYLVRALVLAGPHARFTRRLAGMGIVHSVRRNLLEPAWRIDSDLTSELRNGSELSQAAVDRALDAYSAIVKRSPAAVMVLERTVAMDRILALRTPTKTQKATDASEIARILEQEKVRHPDGVRWTGQAVVRLADEEDESDLFSKQLPSVRSARRDLDVASRWNQWQGRTGRVKPGSGGRLGRIRPQLFVPPQPPSDEERVLEAVRRRGAAGVRGAKELLELAKPMRRQTVFECVRRLVAVGKLRELRAPRNGRLLVATDCVPERGAKGEGRRS